MEKQAINEDIQELPFVYYDRERELKMVIDTGSPKSFSSIDEVTLGNDVHQIRSKFPESIAQYMPDNVVALIGMDILSQYDLMIHADSNEATFSKTPLEPLENALELGSFMQVPTLSIETATGKFNCLLDTGAHISYIAARHVEQLTPIENRSDFNPIIGIFETPIYEYVFRLNGKETTLHVGNLPMMFDQALFGLTDLDALIGLGIFAGRDVLLSFPRNQVYYSK